jgi:hypothetical protein
MGHLLRGLDSWSSNIPLLLLLSLRVRKERVLLGLPESMPGATLTFVFWACEMIFSFPLGEMLLILSLLFLNLDLALSLPSAVMLRDCCQVRPVL